MIETRRSCTLAARPADARVVAGPTRKLDEDLIASCPAIGAQASVEGTRLELL